MADSLNFGAGLDVTDDGNYLTVDTNTVYRGSFTITGTGETTITGIPFKPTTIEFSGEATGGQNVDRGNGSGDAVNNYAGSFSGTASDDGSRQVLHSGTSGNSPSATSHYSADTECIAIRYAGQSGGKLGMLLADVTAWNDDGFTINVSNYQQNEVVMYTAYK